MVIPNPVPKTCGGPSQPPNHFICASQTLLQIPGPKVENEISSIITLLR